MSWFTLGLIPEKITETEIQVPERLYGNFRIGSPSPISTLKTAEISECCKKAKKVKHKTPNGTQLTKIITDAIMNLALCSILRSVHYFTNLAIWLGKVYH